MRDVVTAILGGGQGSRLWPLTAERAKPAVPVGGKFRLIDIPISNSLHARIQRIYVLTQFLSASLHRHISQTYRFDAFSHGFVNILAAEQRADSAHWYQGTADAIRQNLARLVESQPRDILILSGDQLYLMDLRDFVRTHRNADADITVAVKPVPASEAPGLGVMRIDTTGRIVEFVEKPKAPDVIERFQLDAATVEQLGLDAEPGMVLASMGIYTFASPVLRSALDETDHVDFGREVIPNALERYKVHGYVERGYWRDIGTIGTFHEANLELTVPIPDLNLYDPDRPVYTRPRFLPGCKVNGCDVRRSILCDGSIVSAASIVDSIVGVRAVVQPGSSLERTILMGGTMFEDESPVKHEIPIGVGRDTVIRNAIIDLDARIGEGCRIVNADGREHADGSNYAIRDGIVVVPRGATVLPGTEI